MNRKKKWQLGILLLAGLSLTGCSKPTKISVLTGMAAKLAKAKSYSAELGMDMEADVAATGFHMDVDMDGCFVLEGTMDPQNIHMKGSFNVEALGQKTAVDMDLYEIQNEKDIDVYVDTQTSGIDSGWFHSATEMPDMGNPNILTLLKDLNSEENKTFLEGITLEEEPVEINGTECFLLKGTETGPLIEKWAEYLQEMQVSLDEDTRKILESTNWSGIEVPFELYVDQKEKYPVKLTMDLSAAVNSIITDSLQEALFSEALPSSLDLSMNYEKLNLELNFESFDETPKITLPAEIKGGNVKEISANSLS